MRVLIFANGELGDAQGVSRWLRWADRVLAADGGTRHALALGRTPDVVIGDLDSLGAMERALLVQAGTLVLPFSPRKDETDLELALSYAVREGASEIVILAALGGRLDQTLANLLLLALPELEGCHVRIVEGAQTAFLIRGGTGAAVIEGQPGDVISLIPLAGDAPGVTTEGLEWPLNGETLRFGPARGVSNVLRATPAHVHLEQGLLLCVVMARNGGGV